MPSTGSLKIPAKRPMPWCSCTTRSPTERSAQEPSFSRSAMARRRLRLRSAPAAICVSVSTARCASGASRPAESAPTATVARPSGGRAPFGKRRYAVSLEHRCEHIRPAVVRGEHHNAEIVFKIPLHVGKRRFRAAAVARKLADIRIEHRPGGEGIAPRAEGVRHHDSEVRDFFARVLPRQEIIAGLRDRERAFAQDLQIVRERVGNVLRFFRAAVRRVNINDSVRRDEIERR